MSGSGQAYHGNHLWSIGSKINSISLDATDSRILVGCDDGLMRMWEIQNNNFKIRGHIDFKKQTKSIEYISWCLNTKPELFVASSSDGSLMIWNYKNKDKPLMLIKTECKLNKAIFSSEGNFLAACFTAENKNSESKGINFYSTEDYTLQCKFPLKHRVQAIVWGETEETFYIASSNSVKIIRLEMTEKKFIKNAIEQSEEKVCSGLSTCLSIDLSADYRFLVVGSSDSSVNVFETKQMFCISSFYPYSTNIKNVLIIPNTEITISATNEANLMITSMRDGVNLSLHSLYGVVKTLKVARSKKFVVCAYDSKYKKGKYDYCLSVFPSSLFSEKSKSK